MLLSFSAALAAESSDVAWPLATVAQRPNLLWLHVESTDGRLYQEGSPVPIPNIRAVQRDGVNFKNTYANIPICCPSRASVWTGRHPHRLPHTMNGIDVIGAISNYEGLGVEHSKWDKLKMSNLLGKAQYDVQIGGKEDWLSGDHSLTTMVDSWSIYARFPYDIPGHAGNHIWGDCGGKLMVGQGNESVHKGDWNIVAQQTKWLRQRRQSNTSGNEGNVSSHRPFFMYGGFRCQIAHRFPPLTLFTPDLLLSRSRVQLSICQHRTSAVLDERKVSSSY